MPTKQINFLPAFSGVAAGANAVVQVGTNFRAHRIVLSCAAVNYTAPTITLVGAGGTPATFTPTVVNGQITAVAIATAGSGQTPGTYTSAGGGVRITDATGIGAQVSIVVAGGGTVTATPTVVSGGTPGPISPATMISTVRLVVNGVVMRDITAAQILAIEVAAGYTPQLGQLPIFFTEPKRRFLRDADITSWDLTGQNTFSLQVQVATGVTNPGLTGWYEFDFGRNLRQIKTPVQAKAAQARYGNNPATGKPFAIGDQVPFLQPVSQHAYSGIPLAQGVNIINQIPFDYPIARLWLLGSSPGNIYELDVQADSQLILQALTEQAAEAYAEYDFQVNNPYYAPQNGGGLTVAGGSAGSSGNTGVIIAPGTAGSAFRNPINLPSGGIDQSPVQNNGVFPFDVAFIADADGRPWEALRVAQSLILRVYSNVSQTLTVIKEDLPGAYAA